MLLDSVTTASAFTVSSESASSLTSSVTAPQLTPLLTTSDAVDDADDCDPADTACILASNSGGQVTDAEGDDAGIIAGSVVGALVVAAVVVVAVVFARKQTKRVSDAGRACACDAFRQLTTAVCCGCRRGHTP
jgi:hypothetical protein